MSAGHVQFIEVAADFVGRYWFLVSLVQVFIEIWALQAILALLRGARTFAADLEGGFKNRLDVRKNCAIVLWELLGQYLRVCSACWVCCFCLKDYLR